MIFAYFFTTAFLLVLIMMLYAVQRHTFWGISFSRRNFAGVIFIGSHFFFIVPGLFMILQEDPSQSWVLFVLSDLQTAFFANMMIISSLLLFAAFSIIFSVALGSTAVYDGNRFVTETSDPQTLRRLRKIVFAFVSVMIGTLVVIITTTSVTHAVLGSYLTGVAPGVFRHMNTESGLGGLLNLFLQIYTLLIAILCGIPGVVRGRLFKLGVLVAVVFATSLHGDKAPTIMAAIAWSITRLHFIKVASFRRVAGKLLIIVMVALGILMIMVQFYFGDSSRSVMEYFTGRVLLGQMAGFYDQMALQIQSFAFLSHGVPFYSLVGDPVVFHKELMLLSENRFDSRSIGVKNTFFLAESIAIFGPLGYLLGPLIMAYGSLITFITISIVFRSVFRLPVNTAKAVAAMFFCIYFQLTAGITEMVLFKSLILVLIVLSPPVVWFYLTSNIRISPSDTAKARP